MQVVYREPSRTDNEQAMLVKMAGSPLPLSRAESCRPRPAAWTFRKGTTSAAPEQMHDVAPAEYQR